MESLNANNIKATTQTWRDQNTNVNFGKRSVQNVVSAYAVGRLYQSDGPPLGTKFDPLPCGGFYPRTGTLKGEMFNILLEQRSKGMQVSELVEALQVIELDIPKSTKELEELIYAALSSDITLFEKISKSSFRVRLNPGTQKNEHLGSDADDSGSVENDSMDSESDDGEDSDDANDSDSAAVGHSALGLVCYSSNTRKKFVDSEIDESHSGEAWMLGLMEGSTGDLTIEEKLDALVALVDLTAAGASFKVEDPISSRYKEPPRTWLHGSGAKIKKISQNPRPNLFESHNYMKSVCTSQKHGQHPEVSDGPSPQLKTKQGKRRESYVMNNHWMQSVYLGSDRRYNSYWLFLGPCDAKDPGHRRVYFESSEDGHCEEIDTDKGLDTLLSSLDGRGAREAYLLASLEKRETFLYKAMTSGSSAEYEKLCVSENHFVTDITNGSGSSPLSDVDNNLSLSVDSGSGPFPPCNARMYEISKISDQKIEIWHQRRAFDAWVWRNFYYSLGTLKHGRHPGLQSLARCERCNDLYWRDDKHCIICHTTFELDFDIEERYVVHVATCRGTDDHVLPRHKVLSSELQSLKAAICTIEAAMPEEALVNNWSTSGHMLWVKRLRQTSSVPELLQVLSAFVGAIDEEWLYQFGLVLGSHTAFDEIVTFFGSMPETISAVALWLAKLDYLVTCYWEQVRQQKPPQSNQRAKGKRACPQ